MSFENLKVSDWRGYERHDFTFNGHDAIVVLPHTYADGKPWVWRAEFFSAFDTVDMDLLSKGWCLVHYAVPDMYGCPESIALMKKFRDVLVPEYGIGQKCSMFGFSRGGLYTCAYAEAHPEDISSIYLDAPVCSIGSWPGPFGAGGGDAECWAECKGYYKLDDESAKTFRGNPLDKVPNLVKSGIPCILVAGLADSVVPYAENGEKFVKLYRELGGDIKTIGKPGCNHHPHSLEDPTEISEFIVVHK